LELKLLRRPYKMEEEFTGLKKIRETIPPGPSPRERDATYLEEEISDLQKCLAGDSTSKRWKDLNIELTNKKSELLYMKRRLAGRTPLMASWADPLPG
jgi:hypothetical protein